jgi:hypothetical protein
MDELRKTINEFRYLECLTYYRVLTSDIDVKNDKPEVRVIGER